MKKRVAYAWKEGRSYKISAQTVGEELEKIEKRYGQIEPKNIVAAATPVSSPLHKFFEWDNKSAADGYRLWQARMLIGAVFVKSVDDHEPHSPVRAFVNMQMDDSREYVSLTSAMSDEDKRERLLQAAKDEIKLWRDRYAALDEFADLFDRIDSLNTAEGRSRGKRNLSSAPARLG